MKNMNNTQKILCHTIVHTASVATGALGWMIADDFANSTHAPYHAM